MPSDPIIYLDNNATTPLAPCVIEKIVDILPLFGNPSSLHQLGQKARVALTTARRSIAQSLGAKPQELFFTSGGTESISMLLSGFTQLQKKKGHIISSQVEHAAVFQTLKRLEAQGFAIELLPAGSDGCVKPEMIKAAIRPETQLITLMSVNNETGVKTDIEGIAKIASSYNIPFFVDAIASWGKEPLSFPAGVSAFSLSGHKIHAPKGIGCVVIRPGFKLDPLFSGGPQEGGRRGGTENLIGIVAMDEAVNWMDPKIYTYIQSLRDFFESTLTKELQDVFVNGSEKRIGNVSNLAFDGIDGESLLFKLDLMGVAASHGSACSSGALEPSRVLTQMGYPLKRVRSSIRFSFSRMNTFEETERAISLVKEAVVSLRH